MATTSAEERRELRSAVRALLQRRSAEAEVRAAMESASGHQLELWKSMAVELGLQGMAIPEEHGGAGAGWVELAVVFEELGRFLTCVPFLATVGFAGSVLAESGDRAAQERWFPAMAAGECILTAGIAGPERRLDALPVVATRSGSGLVLTGAEAYLLDGASADACFVLARVDDRPALFEVAMAGPGVRTDPVPTSDLTRRFATAHFEAASARMVGAPGEGLEIVARARRRAGALLACEQTGGAAAALETAVEYAKTRVQFGRPIGSFQAVKHRCADMLVAVESARAASWAAIRAVDAGSDGLGLTAAAALKVCSQSYLGCASGNVQVHGGIGFTYEHSAHLHVKRSRGSAVLLGSPHDQRQILNHLISQLHSPRRPADDTVPERNQQ